MIRSRAIGAVLLIMFDGKEKGMQPEAASLKCLVAVFYSLTEDTANVVDLFIVAVIVHL